MVASQRCRAVPTLYAPVRQYRAVRRVPASAVVCCGVQRVRKSFDGLYLPGEEHSNRHYSTTYILTQKVLAAIAALPSTLRHGRNGGVSTNRPSMLSLESNQPPSRVHRESIRELDKNKSKSSFLYQKFLSFSHATAGTIPINARTHAHTQSLAQRKQAGLAIFYEDTPLRQF